MNPDEPVVGIQSTVGDDDDWLEPIASERPQFRPAKSHFAELLKAIEHWIQTR